MHKTAEVQFAYAY